MNLLSVFDAQDDSDNTVDIVVVMRNIVCTLNLIM